MRMLRVALVLLVLAAFLVAPAAAALAAMPTTSMKMPTASPMATMKTTAMPQMAPLKNTVTPMPTNKATTTPLATHKPGKLMDLSSMTSSFKNGLKSVSMPSSVSSSDVKAKGSALESATMQKIATASGRQSWSLSVPAVKAIQMPAVKL